jgi:hypothetical protein
MTDDPRCCGTGTCIINDEGLCWCGQQWDGQKMCFTASADVSHAENSVEPEKSQSNDLDHLVD